MTCIHCGNVEALSGITLCKECILEQDEQDTTKAELEALGAHDG